MFSAIVRISYLNSSFVCRKTGRRPVDVYLCPDIPFRSGGLWLIAQFLWVYPDEAALEILTNSVFSFNLKIERWGISKFDSPIEL
jgi:hypothetical protein